MMTVLIVNKTRAILFHQWPGLQPSHWNVCAQLRHPVATTNIFNGDHTMHRWKVRVCKTFKGSSSVKLWQQKRETMCFGSLSLLEKKQWNHYQKYSSNYFCLVWVSTMAHLLKSSLHCTKLSDEEKGCSWTTWYHLSGRTKQNVVSTRHHKGPPFLCINNFLRCSGWLHQGSRWTSHGISLRKDGRVYDCIMKMFSYWSSYATSRTVQKQYKL